MLFGGKGFLQVWVKVKPDWRNKTSICIRWATGKIREWKSIIALYCVQRITKITTKYWHCFHVHGRIDAQARGRRRLKRASLGQSRNPLRAEEFEFYKKMINCSHDRRAHPSGILSYPERYDKYMSACVCWSLPTSCCKMRTNMKTDALILRCLQWSRKTFIFTGARLFFSARGGDDGDFPRNRQLRGVRFACAGGRWRRFPLRRAGEICPQCIHVKAVKGATQLLPRGLLSLRIQNRKEANGITLEDRDARGVVKLFGTLP